MLPGRAVRVVAVVRHEGQTEVRVEIEPGLPDGTDARDVLYRMALADSVGTEYAEQGGGFLALGGPVSPGHRLFRPAVPVDAAELRITLATPAGEPVHTEVVALL